ncbi:hypothetical protein [Tritonibacter scottomollicae]
MREKNKNSKSGTIKEACTYVVPPATARPKCRVAPSVASVFGMVI